MPANSFAPPRAPRSALSALITALCLSLSAPAWAQSEPAESAPPPAAAQSASSQQSADTGQTLLAEADAIASQVGELRGLPLKEEIVRGIKNRDELRQILLKRLAEEVSNEDIENEAAVYKRLGMLPEELDYKEALLNILTEQIAGFYDQHDKELYVMEGLPLDLQRPAMAHEIFHAIQDQHFNIKRMTEPVDSQENGDFAMARSALIEGDASLVMIDYSLYERGVLPQGEFKSALDIPMMAGVLEKLTRQDVGALAQLLPDAAVDDAGSVDPTELDESALAQAPAMVRKLLVFPYFAGMRFVIHARQNNDWSAVDQIYQNPPTSTEQILHPERYFEGDEPVVLEFSTEKTLPDSTQIYENVLGEYQMRLFVEEHLLEGEEAKVKPAEVDQALEGWGGDRLRAFRSEDDNVLITHLSVWDTIQDANEYFDILEAVMKARYPKAKVERAEGKYGRSITISTTTTQTDEGERLYIEQWGDLVLHMEGLPSTDVAREAGKAASGAALRDEIMRSQKRSAFDALYQEKLQAYDREQASDK